MNEQQIQQFWQSHPCDDRQFGGPEKYRRDYREFFKAYDAARYRQQRHIPLCLDGIAFAGRRALEIGLGQGADSEQIIRRGAMWSGIDLTEESVERVRIRLELGDLPYGTLMQASALAIPFDDNTFDIVFSHGVLHHIPEIRTAQREIHRVLKPEGELIAMLYAKRSLNYMLCIRLLRRVGLAMMYAANKSPCGIYGEHLASARAMGLGNYLDMTNFVHRNTDGPHNPYSKVYDLRAVNADFEDFRITTTYKCFMHAPPLPVGWLPLQRLMGWHLWVHMKPVLRSAA